MLKRGVLRLLSVWWLVGAVVALGAPVFPVKYSADQRYLVDQAGVPFPIMGRTAWFVTSLSVADYHTFIDDTAARGYSAIELHVINHDPRGNHPPFNGNGDAPFLKRLDGSSWNGVLSGIAPDFTTPNEAYWSVVDGFLAYCEAKGILVFMFPAYVGYQGGDQGWMQEVLANGPAKIQAYGAFMATRYKNQKNLVWMMGGDMGTAPNTFNPAQTNVEAALLAGIKSVAGLQSTYFSAEWNSASIGTDQVTFGTAMTLNSAYDFGGDVNTQGRRAYAYSPVEPAFLLEEPYDEEGPDGNNVNGSATQPVRRFQWWGWLSTIGGYISGNGYVWPFNPGWSAHLDTQGARDMARLNAFIQSMAWYKLVPSGLGGMKTLITAGGSIPSAAFYVAAAAAPDGSLLIAYLPPNNMGPITVDMTAMSGLARARWFDPTSALYTDITGGTYNLPNTGTHTFTPPGNNSRNEKDWVLFLDVAPATKARTWVSSAGKDTNDCSVTAPCRSFLAAIASTSNGGEVVVIDSAAYGPAIIGKALSIVAAPGAYAGVTVSSGTGFVINAGNGVVTLGGLTVNGLGGAVGIDYQSGAALYIERMSITGFAASGISATPSAAGTVFVRDSGIRNNASGAVFAPPAAAPSPLRVSIERTKFEGNVTGIMFSGNSASATINISTITGGSNGIAIQPTIAGAAVAIDVRRSTVGRNSGAALMAGNGAAGTTAKVDLVSSQLSGSGIGLSVGSGGSAFVTDSTIMRNGTGVALSGGGLAVSLGDNRLVNNATNGAFSSSTPKR